MKMKNLYLSIFILVVAFSFVSDGWSQDRSKIVRLKEIKAKEVTSPEYEFAKKASNRRTLQWFEIQSEYETAMKWTDELKFTYYVLMENREERQRKLFRGVVTNIDIEEGKHLSAVYMHPSTLKRHGEVKSVALIIQYQGRTELIESEPKAKRRWWEEFTPIDGYILNRLQTPFMMRNFDNYEAIKPRGQ